MPSRRSTTIAEEDAPKQYQYRTIQELYQLTQPSGAKWCFYGVVKFRRHINANCILLGICDRTSYGKGPKGVSCLLYRQSFAGTIELPVDVEVGDLIRLHRMKITGYKPESGCLQLKSSNYYSWLIFDGKDDTNHDPIAQSSVSYSFSNDDRQKIDDLRRWMLSFPDEDTLHNELDLQFVLPESTSSSGRSSLTVDSSPAADTDGAEQSGSSDFFSASEEIEPKRKRVRGDQD